MHTRPLPIGSTYTGSNSSLIGGTVPATLAPAAPAAVQAPATLAPAADRASVGRSTPGTYAPSGPVTYGRAAPVVLCRPIAPTNSSAIAAFVISLISFISSFFFLGFLGIIFGHVARSQTKRRGERGNGMAVAALWLGYLGVIFWVLFWLAYFGIIALIVGLAVAADTGTIS